MNKQKQNNNELGENELQQLLNNYKEKYGVYPLNAPQLLNHAAEIGKQLRYSFVNKSFRQWINQNNEEYASHISGVSSMLKQKDKTGNDSKAGKPKEDACWDSIWADYVKTYSTPPKEPLHLWNHSKEMKYSTKYSEVRKLFPSLQLKHNPEQTNAKDSGSDGDKVSRKIKKQEDMTTDELNDYVNQYVIQYKYHPKDARVLFNYCVEDLKVDVQYKAVAKAFSLFYTPPSDVQKRCSIAPVLTRNGFFVEYDKFVSRKQESIGSLISQEGVSQTTNEPGNQNDNENHNHDHDHDHDNGNDNATLSSGTETLQFPGVVNKESVGEKAQVNEMTMAEEEGVVIPGTEMVSGVSTKEKEKIGYLTSVVFNEMWAKYQNEFQKAPQSAKQLLTFATEHGYNVTYGAIRRSWPSSGSQ